MLWHLVGYYCSIVFFFLLSAFPPSTPFFFFLFLSSDSNRQIAACSSPFGSFDHTTVYLISKSPCFPLRSFLLARSPVFLCFKIETYQYIRKKAIFLLEELNNNWRSSPILPALQLLPSPIVPNLFIYLQLGKVKNFKEGKCGDEWEWMKYGAVKVICWAN